MTMSWKLGRVAGIDLYLHPTFLLVLAYPQVFQGGALSILLVLSIFGCVLLHELGHALMARRFGIETADITLYPIGGVARLLKMPKSPGAELAIALAGPAVNVLIVAALIAFAVVAPFDWSESVLGVYVLNLILANGLLALFNLVPAFPMDGGRVLRALLSTWLGRARATLVAASLGRGIALLFGLYSLAHGEWMRVVLAAFIFIAAGSELKRVLAEEDRLDHDEDATAPPGYRWIHRGNGLWQLAPVTVHVAPGRNVPPWR